MQFFLKDFLTGDGTRARALRSSAILVFGFGSSNILRLASNLVLARLLFPEAFGLMSLVYVFLIGLAMFSDLGLNLSIIQNKRGEEPESAARRKVMRMKFSSSLVSGTPERGQFRAAPSCVQAVWRWREQPRRSTMSQALSKRSARCLSD